MASALDLVDGRPAPKLKCSVFSAEWMAAQKDEWADKTAKQERRYDELMKEVNPRDYPLWINPTPDKDYSNEKDPVICKNRMTEIQGMLHVMGVTVAGRRSTGNCVAAAIFNGFIKITGDPKELDMVVFADAAEDGEQVCGHVIYMTLRELLLQPDCCAGDDPTDGCERATVYCTRLDCYGRVYVSAICTGYPRFDSYYHNHCPGLNFGNCN